MCGRPYRYAADASPRRFRFGVLAGALDGVSDDIRAAFDRSLDVLRDFGGIEDAALPELPWEAATRIILQAEAASAFDDFIAGTEAFGTRIQPLMKCREGR